MDDAINCVKDASNLLNSIANISTARSQVDHLRHTFLKKTEDIAPLYSSRWWDPFVYISCWEDMIDSEYVVRCLSVRLRSGALSKMYTWAKNNGNNSLTSAVFEILLHRLAADNDLDLYIIEYDPPENGSRQLKMERVHLEDHDAICSGRAADPMAHLTTWRDDERFSYWFLGFNGYPDISSIVKLKSTSDKKGNVAYLQFTVAAQHDIDDNQLKEMNKIFYPEDVKSAGDTEQPIYIAVCPDLESCKALVLDPATVSAAREVCRVFVGYPLAY
ncbi:unnamed protein product [Peronospora farinosa]|nr:unnamed protein product [Peronospora farinosa]